MIWGNRSHSRTTLPLPSFSLLYLSHNALNISRKLVTCRRACALPHPNHPYHFPQLNFKGPGGAGFKPHQDATAYATEQLASRHVSAMVAVDAATVANGCVEVTSNTRTGGTGVYSCFRRTLDSIGAC